MSQPATLVERLTPQSTSLIGELTALANAANYNVVDVIQQVRYRDSRYQVGRGKADEIRNSVKEHLVQKVIFENELSPVQAYNLSKLVGIEVIDKFQLILDVFSKHASTNEARLQIKLATLRYELTRAKEKVRLARLGEQPGFHGLGKYEVTVYHESIRRQIVTIEKKLQKIRMAKDLHIFSRNESGFPLISLSGYTGAGKSSLFNALAQGQALVTDRPFTTLSTKILAVEFDSKRALLSDTVGFIDNLPLTLVESFRSTLLETINADLILLVVDCSEDTETVTRKLDCCRRTLREIGVINKPIITVLNKLDLTSEEAVKKLETYMEDMALNPVAISALHGTNMSSLRETIAGKLGNFVRASFELPLESSTMSLISKVRSQSTVLNETFQEKTVYLRVQSVDYVMEKIRNWIEQVGGKLLESTRV